MALRSDRHNLLLVLAVAAVTGISFQGSRGLYETTEGRYAECAREMVETNNWLTPQLDYKPHLSKPPLAYWAIAAGLKAAGRNEWGARLPGALAFILISLALYRIGSLMWDDRTGLLAGVVFATSPFAVAGENSLSTDIFLALWSVLTVMGYWKAQRAQTSSAGRIWMLSAWLFAAMGFLTKGPPSLLTPASILIFHFYFKRRDEQPKPLYAFPGVLLFLAAGLSWYVFSVFKHSGTASYFLGQEVFERIFTGKFHRNPHWYSPVFVYLLPIVLGLGGWLAFIPGILRRYGALKKPFMFARSLTSSPEKFFAAIWCVLPLIVLSVSRSRLPLYMLPFFPAIVLGIARSIRMTGESLQKRKIILVVVCSALLLASAKNFSQYYKSDLDMRRLYNSIPAAVPGRTDYFIYRENNMFGLQFYLDGSLKRVRGQSDTGRPGVDLEAVINNIKTGSDKRKTVFVVRKNNTSLERRLEEAGIPLNKRRASGSFYIISLREGSLGPSER